jgi:hypothetical protein
MSNSRLESNKLATNIILNNVFNDNELSAIYNTIDFDAKEKTEIISMYGQKAWFSEIPQEVRDSITKTAIQVYGQQLKLEEISFARYSNEYGDFPVLTPHYDNAFKEQRVTVDVQLKSNINWPIVIEGKSFNLKDNQAVTFSGTHQIHWREHMDFSDGDFIEMLFCHFSLENSKPITLEEKLKIEKQIILFSNRFSMKLIKENKKLRDQIKSYTYE